MVKYGWLLVHLPAESFVYLMKSTTLAKYWKVLMCALIKSSPKKHFVWQTKEIWFKYELLPSGFKEIGFALHHILGAIFNFVILLSFLNSCTERLFKSVLPFVRVCCKFTQVHNQVSLSFIIVFLLEKKKNNRKNKWKRDRNKSNVKYSRGSDWSLIEQSAEWFSLTVLCHPGQSQEHPDGNSIQAYLTGSSTATTTRAEEWRGVWMEGRVKRVKGRSPLQPGLEAGGNLFLG